MTRHHVAISCAVVVLCTSVGAIAQGPGNVPAVAQQVQLDDIHKTLKEVRQDVDALKQGQVPAGVERVDKKIDALDQRLAKLDEKMDSFKPSWIRDWGPLIGTFVMAGVAIFSLLLNINTMRDISGIQQETSKKLAEENLNTTKALADINRQTTTKLAEDNLLMADRTRKEKAREEERKAIREKIDGFYGPFVQLRGMSSYLYQTLFMPRRTPKELADYADGNRYRTVIALVQGHPFDAEDKEILKKIVAIGKQTAELIQTKIGLVDDKKLLEVLPHAVAHYWLIDQLVNGGLTVTDPASRPHYEMLTFPDALDPEVKAELNRLNRRLAELQS